MHRCRVFQHLHTRDLLVPLALALAHSYWAPTIKRVLPRSFTLQTSINAPRMLFHLDAFKRAQHDHTDRTSFHLWAWYPHLQTVYSSLQIPLRWGPSSSSLLMAIRIIAFHFVVVFCSNPLLLLLQCKPHLPNGKFHTLQCKVSPAATQIHAWHLRRVWEIEAASSVDNDPLFEILHEGPSPPPPKTPPPIWQISHSLKKY